MDRPTKRIITKDYIKHALLHEKKSRVLFTWAICGAGCVFFIPISLLAIGIISKQNIYLFWKLLVCIPFGLMCVVPIAVFLFSFAGYRRAKAIIERGEFEVRTCKVAYKIEEDLNNSPRGSAYAEKIYFVGYGEGVIVDHTTYQLTSEGDTFYFVTYGTTPLLLYPTKLYEYREK